MAKKKNSRLPALTNLASGTNPTNHRKWHKGRKIYFTSSS